jgi:hypothetical protein
MITGPPPKIYEVRDILAWRAAANASSEASTCEMLGSQLPAIDCDLPGLRVSTPTARDVVDREL